MLRCTPATELRIGVDWSRTTSSRDVGRQLLRELAGQPLDVVHHLDRVLALRLDDVQRDRALAVDQRSDSFSSWPSTTRATWDR